jgi:MerR family transcriptional regulator, thiopeptide resistance regulator
MKAIIVYTVKQLSSMAGVSTRTLHFYDQIGLLKADRNPVNGYRIYDQTAALRLQQILFLRELDLSLDQIHSVIDRPDFDLLNALEQHRQALVFRQTRLERLLQTVERTISYLKGNNDMEGKELFVGFSEEQQKEYEIEAQRRWGDTEVKESQSRWKSYPAEKKRQILDEAGEIYESIVEAIPYGPASLQAQEGINRWRQNLQYFYEPTTEIMLGLAEGYVSDPDFNATFQRIHPELAGFMLEAVKIYCQGIRDGC